MEIFYVCKPTPYSVLVAATETHAIFTLSDGNELKIPRDGDHMPIIVFLTGMMLKGGDKEE